MTLRRLSAFFLACALSCLSFMAAAAPKPPEVGGLRPKDGEGVLLLHLAQDFPVAAPIGFYTPPVQLQRVDNGKKYIVSADSRGMQSSLHFIGALPAGRYRLYDFEPQVGCWVCKHATRPPNPSMPEVEIRAGQVAYLGTIQVSTRVKFDDNDKQQRTVSWGWNESPEEAFGRRVFAALQPALATWPLHRGWTETREAGLDKRWRDAILSNSAGMVLGGRHGRDGFYFGAQNGVVKRWRPGSDIELLDTGSDFFLTSVAVTQTGTLLAAGEAGTLRASRDDGRTWEDRGAALPFGVVSNLTMLDDADGVAFTLTRSGQVSVYRGQAAAGEFEKVAELPLKFAFWTGMPGVMSQMFRHDRHLILTLPSRKFALIDLSNAKSEILDPPGSIGNFKISPDGTLWCTCAKSIAFSPYVSRDLGRTWQPSDISRFMMLPEFFDDRRGFSYQGAIFSAEKTGIMTTSDGGATWTYTHEPDINKAWWWPAYSADGSVMLLHSAQVFGTLGFTMSKYSLDEGKTWQVVPDRMIWRYGPGAR